LNQDFSSCHHHMVEHMVKWEELLEVYS
jgi:hypothetical protein